MNAIHSLGLALLGLLSFVYCSDPAQQIHLSYLGTPTEMNVNWVTEGPCAKMMVQFGTTSGIYPYSTVGQSEEFRDLGWELRTWWIHNALLTQLQPSTLYYYRIGDNSCGFSEEFTFTTLSANPKTGFTAAVYGDFGYKNAQALDQLINDTVEGKYDFVLHVGDMAYDLQDDNGRTGDNFLRQIQPIAARVPYQVCPGNHEFSLDFYHYRNRFTMPGDEDNFWYSWDIGPVHFVAYSTEVYFSDIWLLEDQYSWLEKDLHRANQNRKQRPWIIMYGHRPMYCSDITKKKEVVHDCGPDADRLRHGLEGFGPIEKLLYQYGVDIYICGHTHSYERTYPVYEDKVLGTYASPNATVHFITGSAGCPEGLEEFAGPNGPWSAFRSSTYGFSRLQVMNETAIHWQYVLSTGQVADDLWITQTTHSGFPH